MRIAVVGSRPRFLKDPYAVKRLVRAHVAAFAPMTIVISGAAPGVDTWAAEAARDYGFVCVEYPADWRPDGVTVNRRAGYMRNQLIVEQCDKLDAFWNGESKGTRDVIERARKAGKLGLVKVVAAAAQDA